MSQYRLICSFEVIAVYQDNSEDKLGTFETHEEALDFIKSSAYEAWYFLIREYYCKERL